jgi:hypothetical protein
MGSLGSRRRSRCRRALAGGPRARIPFSDLAILGRRSHWRCVVVSLLCDGVELVPGEAADPAAPSAPIEESLQKALNVQKSQCQAAGRPYYTLDTLLTLLAVANGRAARCFDIVKPGWATEVRTRLHEHAAELKNEGFVPFEWTERPEVQEAQAAAKRSQARAVTDVHLLLGVLDTPSNTLTDLEKTYGDNVSQLRTAATKAAAQRAVSPTPGVGDAANNTI